MQLQSQGQPLQLHRLEGFSIVANHELRELKEQVNMNISVIQQNMEQSGLDTQSNTFADKTQLEVERLEVEQDSKPFKCDKCKHFFDHQWLLTRHQKACLREAAKWRRLKYGDSYTCLVCQEDFKNKEQLKSHLFNTHLDVEVHSKYNKSVEALIGPCFLQKLREPVLKKLADGTFDSHILKLIGKNEKNTTLPTRTYFSILMDYDDDQSELRQTAY